MERCEPVPDTLLCRVTVEFLGPVPVAELAVSARLLRGGRRVQLLAAELACDGRPVLRAQAWRMRWRPQDGLAAIGSQPAPPPGEPLPAVLPRLDFGYGRAMQWREADGSSLRPGPATVWARLRGPLVAGEPPSAVQRVVVAADSGSGVSWVLDWDSWSFVNVDLSVHLVRPPRGEWVCMAASTHVEPEGVALASTVLYDEGGRIGTAAQSLLVEPR
jgi:hypothetical protein